MLGLSLQTDSSWLLACLESRMCCIHQIGIEVSGPVMCRFINLARSWAVFNIYCSYSQQKL